MDQTNDEAEPEYPPHSPWSSPPVRRSPPPQSPAPAREGLPEPPRWTRREITSGRRVNRPDVALPPAAPPQLPPAPLYLPSNGYEPADAEVTVPPRSTVGDPWVSPEPLAPAYPPPTYPSPTDAESVHGYPTIEVEYRAAGWGGRPAPQVQYPVPTADDLTARRVVRPREWVATTGMRAAARRGTFGLVRLRPNRRERQTWADVTAVRRAFGGLRQITVVNPKGGAGKTVATLMLGLTFGQTRGGFVLAWDNNETQGTLGMRAQTDLHGRTVRDLLRDLHRFTGSGGRVGELSGYVRPQDDAAFDVLASDEAAAAGEMLTATAFRDIRDVVGRFYKLLLVDTGNNVRADNWQAAVDATDQLVVTMSVRNDSAETAARLLDHLEQTGRRELVRRAVTVMTLPPHRQDVNPRVIERHFEQRCRVVMRVPYDRHLDSGAPVAYPSLSPESRRAWLRVAAAVADGL